MPTASRQVRKNRRIRRERTLAIRYARVAANQRDQVIQMYNTLLANTKRADILEKAVETNPLAQSSYALPAAPEEEPSHYMHPKLRPIALTPEAEVE
jgi:hypothetical protein